MSAASNPMHLSRAVSELIALKGLARVQGEAQLETIWRDLAGPKFAGRTKVLGIRRGVLQIGVGSAPLLSELVSFHQRALLRCLHERHPHLGIRDLRFRLRSEIHSA